MARPRLFEEQQLLQQVAGVFWQRGYAGTRTKDLEQATGLLRGSLYNAFQDKHQLYLAALDYYLQREIGASIQALQQAEEPKAALAAWMQQVIDQARQPGERRGCLLCDAAIELSTLYPDVAERVQHGLQRLQQAVGQVLAMAVDDCEQTLQTRAGQLLSSYLGLRVLAKAGVDEQQLQVIKQQIQADLEKWIDA